MKRLILAVSVSLILVTSSHIGQLHARQTIVAGSISAGYDYETRSYDNEIFEDQFEGDSREWFLRPEIEIRSLDVHNLIAFRYSPSIVYDQEDDETDIDHFFDLEGEHYIKRNWLVQLSNSFVLSSDPDRFGSAFDTPGLEDEPDEEFVPDEISQDLGRRRFWTNEIAVGTTYTYVEGSDIGINYAFRILRNEDDDDDSEQFDEFDRHEISGLWSYLINPAYFTSINFDYTIGSFDTPPGDLSRDLDEYGAIFQLVYQPNVSNSYPLVYSFERTEFEDERLDTWVHQLTASWTHSIDEQTSFTVGAGPSYADADGLDPEWGYNAVLQFDKRYQHGSILASLTKEFDTQNFTGSDDSGVRDITDILLEGTYQFTEFLSSNAFVGYTYEDILNPGGIAGQTDFGDSSNTRDSIFIGGGIAYTFLRWFVASVNYEFTTQDGDLDQDDYDEHRVIAQVTGSKELWQF